MAELASGPAAVAIVGGASPTPSHEGSPRRDRLLAYMTSSGLPTTDPPPHEKYAEDYAFASGEVCRTRRIAIGGLVPSANANGGGGSRAATSVAATLPAGDTKPEADGDAGKTVIYWMSRDQRVCDNWALLRAQEAAEARGHTLAVVFCLLLPSGFLGATARQFGFMLRGLKQVEHDLARLNIPFVVLRCGAGEGDGPAARVAEFAQAAHASLVVSDFSPLRVAKQWRAALVSRLSTLSPPISLEVVDAHNIVPVWVASDKQEFSARTLRFKLWKAAPHWMAQAFPCVKAQKVAVGTPARPGGGGGGGGGGGASVANVKVEPPGLFAPPDWGALLGGADGLDSLDWSVPEVDWLEAGERAAHAAVRTFLQRRLRFFATQRNDPCNRAACSDLSPYVHFGQVAPARAVLELMRVSQRGPKHFFVKDRCTGPQVFVEEFLIRRELSDNFCHYCADYDNVNGAHAWAIKTIEEHRADAREFMYSRDELEAAGTHDALWNAAQTEMVQRGKMAGFMRMYWAKKILEWTESTEQALEFAIYLNDRYELDGRDPNGYAGCMWSIVGTHDRAWTERPIFGKVRFMNFNGCKRKFDVARYIALNGNGNGAAVRGGDGGDGAGGGARAARKRHSTTGNGGEGVQKKRPR